MKAELRWLLLEAEEHLYPTSLLASGVSRSLDWWLSLPSLCFHPYVPSSGLTAYAPSLSLERGIGPTLNPGSSHLYLHWPRPFSPSEVPGHCNLDVSF